MRHVINSHNLVSGIKFSKIGLLAHTVSEAVRPALKKLDVVVTGKRAAFYPPPHSLSQSCQPIQVESTPQPPCNQ